MKVTLDTCNYFVLKGTILRVNIYAGGKAANVVVATRSEESQHVSVKFFNAAVFPLLSQGQPVTITGHIGSNAYKNKEGETVYKDNNDLIADAIDIDETKKASEQRKMEELYG